MPVGVPVFGVLADPPPREGGRADQHPGGPHRQESGDPEGQQQGHRLDIPAGEERPYRTGARVSETDRAPVVEATGVVERGNYHEKYEHEGDRADDEQTRPDLSSSGQEH